MKTFKTRAAQGEVTIIKINAVPGHTHTRPVEKTSRGYIISHSESGHHHLLTGGDVMEKVADVPAGMQVFYAILEQPEAFIQDAAVPHDGYRLDPGVYEFRVSREFNPFAEQARRVAD